MTSAITDAWPKMTSRQEFDFLTDLVLKPSTGDHTFLSLRDVHGGTTRLRTTKLFKT